MKYLSAIMLYQFKGGSFVMFRSINATLMVLGIILWTAAVQAAGKTAFETKLEALEQSLANPQSASDATLDLPTVPENRVIQSGEANNSEERALRALNKGIREEALEDLSDNN